MFDTALHIPSGSSALTVTFIRQAHVDSRAEQTASDLSPPAGELVSAACTAGRWCAVFDPDTL